MAAHGPFLNLFLYQRPQTTQFCFRHQFTLNAEQGFGYERKCYETCEIIRKTTKIYLSCA